MNRLLRCFFISVFLMSASILSFNFYLVSADPATVGTTQEFPNNSASGSVTETITAPTGTPSNTLLVVTVGHKDKDKSASSATFDGSGSAIPMTLVGVAEGNVAVATFVLATGNDPNGGDVVVSFSGGGIENAWHVEWYEGVDQSTPYDSGTVKTANDTGGSASQTFSAGETEADDRIYGEIMNEGAITGPTSTTGTFS